MTLETAFENYIRDEKLFTINDHLLVAVSGGVDSVVLCSLLHRSGFKFSIAHCNFQLRGEESDADAAFTENLASSFGAAFHYKKFDTLVFSNDKSIGIQEAARELRYAWFNELLEEYGYKFFLTAHHRDDNIETVLMNFFKGTGLRGLKSILPKSGKLCRPLLFTGKDSLISFASSNGISYREDSSNSSDKYTRNYFRHHLLPVISGIIPGFDNIMADNINRFRSQHLFYKDAVNKELKKLVVHEKGHSKLPVLKLLKTPGHDTLLFELLTPLGFTAGQVAEVVKLLHSGSGKYVSSSTHRVLRNRAWILISELTEVENVPIIIHEGDDEIEYPGGLLQIIELKKVADLNTDSNIAMIDRKLVKYPLLLRKWKTGDYFYPLGMKGKKKLSRFFIDQKLSVLDKEHTWVLESEKRIVWVIGKRIDDRFKLKTGSENVLKISLIPAE